ncbi:MAG: Mu-like prophage major head subunit gpT family protein [Verrucomicrobia bacterium]|nr:Mu-like prophage major head subunit gpT family protein [Verrucomicrobiota bacterium]
MLVTQENVQKVFRGLRAVIMQRLAKPGNQVWQKLATSIQCDGESEDLDFLMALPPMRELIGEVAIQNLRLSGFTLDIKEFELTIGVPVSAIRRDKLGLLNPRAEAMADRAIRLPNKLVTKLLGEGFTTKDYCNSYFFAAGKKEYGKASAFTNLLTTALTAANYEAARALLRKRLDDKGESMELGDQLALIVPPELEAKAKSIVVTDTLTTGGKNPNAGSAELIVLTGLSTYSSTAWYLADIASPIKPLVVGIEYEPITNECTNPGDSHVVKHQEFLYQVLRGIGSQYAAPRQILGSTGVAATPTPTPTPTATS